MAKKKVKRKKKPSGNPNPYQARKVAAEVLQGNSFWKLRSKHGRDKLFASPKLMLEAAEEYFKAEDSRTDFDFVKPMVVSNGGGGGSRVKMVRVPAKTPYTLIGFALYCGASSSYLRTFKNSLKAKGETMSGLDRDFLSVIESIEEMVYKNQYDGASAGHFNANIIARALGLVDKQDVTSGEQPIQAPIINIIKGSAPKLAGDEKDIDSKKI